MVINVIRNRLLVNIKLITHMNIAYYFKGPLITLNSNHSLFIEKFDLSNIKLLIF